MKRVKTVSLTALPGMWDSLVRFLSSMGATNLALFGGAVRDTDLGIKPNDYDVRVWMDDEKKAKFLLALRSKVHVNQIPSDGTNKPRYLFNFKGVPVDLSIREIPEEYEGCYIPVSAVAKNRVLDADIGLSAIALDPIGVAWATDEYELDKKFKRLTVYPKPPHMSTGRVRIETYTDRMHNKFPTFEVVKI
jgi:hypothetical protein